MLRLGIIGGSGLYAIDDLTDVRTADVVTPFGAPSDPPVTGRIGDTEIVFISRHGRGHRFSPSNLPYRANIYALKQLGVTHVLSVSAVGSLREELPPRSLVLPDQVIDRTVDRPRTFFDDGVVAHVGIASPFCPLFRDTLNAAASAIGQPFRKDGTYVCIEGPQFSTRAESTLYRSWDASIIGMTVMPEARLAREAELCYATAALVTDYDVWHDTEAEVSVESVASHLAANVATSLSLMRSLLHVGLPDRSCGCADALANAIVTDPATLRVDTLNRLGLIGERYLPRPPKPS